MRGSSSGEERVVMPHLFRYASPANWVSVAELRLTAEIAKRGGRSRIGCAVGGPAMFASLAAAVAVAKP